MTRKNVHWIIALIAVGVDSKCSDFSPERKLNELPSQCFPTRLGEKVEIELPRAVTANNISYHLTKPNGEEVNLSRNTDAEVNLGNPNSIDRNYKKVEPKLAHDKIPHLESIFKGKYLSNSKDNNIGISTKDDIKVRVVENEKGESMETVEVGPVTEEHFGNWVISMCSSDSGNVLETFQVFSVHISEPIDIVPNGTIKLKVSEDLNVRLTKAIPGLQSCELVAPASIFDREYDRDPEYPDFCGYLVRNVTVEDTGLWTVIASGDIVYRGTVDVQVVDNK